MIRIRTVQNVSLLHQSGQPGYRFGVQCQCIFHAMTASLLGLVVAEVALELHAAIVG